MRRTDGSDGGAAFPTHPIYSGDDRSHEYDGMTLRDYFAAKALLRMPIDNTISYGETARRAYLVADAMLEERSK